MSEVYPVTVFLSGTLERMNERVPCENGCGAILRFDLEYVGRKREPHWRAIDDATNKPHRCPNRSASKPVRKTKREPQRLLATKVQLRGGVERIDVAHSNAVDGPTFLCPRHKVRVCKSIDHRGKWTVVEIGRRERRRAPGRIRETLVPRQPHLDEKGRPCQVALRYRKAS